MTVRSQDPAIDTGDATLGTFNMGAYEKIDMTELSNFGSGYLWFIYIKYC